MNRSTTRKLIGLFLFSAMFYAIAACLLRDAPNIVIDESLYTNLARSILYEGRIAYRSQPIDYPYLLYPLFLVPVYRLQSLLGGDIYLWVKIFNALLITSSLFPVYLLAKACTGNDKKAFTAAAFTTIMPDMLMSAFEMTEALIWPLSLWLMYFGWKLVSAGKVKYGLLTGLFTGLLYTAKPGAIAMGAGLMLYLLFIRIRKKNSVGDILAGLGALLFVIILLHAVNRFCFGYEFSPLGLYTKQTSDWQPSHILASLLGFAGMAAGFVFIGGGVFVLAPYLMRRNLKEECVLFLYCATAGLLAALLGTAVLVVPYGWSGTLKDIGLHMRYVAMYLPVWIILSLSPKEKKNTSPRVFKRPLLVFSALALLLGLKFSLLPAAASTVDSLSLGAFIHNGYFDGTTPGIVYTILLSVFALCAAFTIDPNFPHKGKKLVLPAFAFFLLYNTVCAAVAIRLPVINGSAADAVQMNEWLLETDEPPLGVMQSRYSDVLTYRLEAHLSRPMQQVTNEQMISSALSSGGVYSPFVPVDQNPNKNNGLTPETHTLVLGETILSTIEPAAKTKVRITDNGAYALLTIPEGERWVDSMLYGLDEDLLVAGREASIFLWEKRPEGAVLKLRVTGPKQGAALRVTVQGQTSDFTVSGTQELDVPLSGTSVQIISDTDLTIHGYSTVS